MQTLQFLEQTCGEPDPRYSPAPIWWWSGEKLSVDRMRWQMDQLRAMGIRNVVVLNLAPNGPLFGSVADDPPFLSEPWWTIFAKVCDHARHIGMFVWFYDQIGFSGANYQAELVAAHPEFSGQQLGIATAEGTGALRVECPGAATPLAAYVVTDNQVRYVPVSDRAACVDASTRSKLCLVYSLRQGYDYFDPAACDKLLDTVHRQFERRLPQHIGTTIVGSFQDELPDLPTWGRTFADSFADAFGYRLEQVIHRLFEPGDAEARRTRLHYHQHRANLAEQAFFKPFFRWHQEHGLACGFDQQSPAREARALGCVQKYADYIQTHRWYAIPGCDLHGNARLHSSIAFMYNRPRVWIEGFHSTGWGGSIADTFDWLMPFLQSGANFYNPHAVYYSTRMGWWEWAPPSTCWRQPYAMHYRGFAEMICRLTKLLSQGVQQASVGVVFPTATVQANLGPTQSFADAAAADQTLYHILGSMRWHEAELGVLDRLAIDFHILDEPTIQAASVSACTQGEMNFNGVSLGTLILPHITMLDDATVAKLRAFARAGGRILAVGSSTIETPDGDVLDIAALPHALVVASVDALTEALRTTPRQITSPVPFLHRQCDDLHILFIPACAGKNTRVRWTGWFASLDEATIDPDRYLKCVDLVLPDSVKQVVRYDPVENRGQALNVRPDGRLHLDFEGAPFAILIWSDSEQRSFTASTNASAPSRTTLLTLSDAWTCEYVPTLPETFADIYDPGRPELRWPHTAEFTWRIADRTDSQPQTVRATFGIGGWARIADQPPRPLVYSPQFGIAQDEIHLYTLGPKGFVPEEFIDLGRLQTGQTATITTSVCLPTQRSVVLAVGANARKRALLAGQLFEQPDDGAYLWLTAPFVLPAGQIGIELSLTAERDGRVRAYWCLLEPEAAERFRRPERMIPPDPPVKGSRLTYRATFVIRAPLAEARAQVTAAAVATVYVDDQLLGHQGGFDPYRLHTRSVVYPLPPLPPGSHQIRIDLVEPQGGAPLLVDLCGRYQAGGELRLLSGPQWTVSRDDQPAVPVKLYSKPEGDAAVWRLRPGAHPLPQSSWLNGPQPSDVLQLDASPIDAQPVVQILEWTIPPGAQTLRLPLEADVQIVSLHIDGQPIAVDAGASVDLRPAGPTPARQACLRVRSRRLGGGVFSGPLSYTFAQGRLACGSWLCQGLRSYSGAIRMKQRFFIQGLGQDPSGRLMLDLGRVRGTVQAMLNGQSLGQRFMTPYRFEIPPDCIRPGTNELDLLLTNTLANFLSTWSPTRGWSPDQFVCGLFGPVTLSRATTTSS
ncbi:hypothetical protein [Fontivita pretiosa]|uniref:hypothetical protein n=1 Tax=Fontivita pretiosa TaxID=2989684 RepID=UPI003D1873DE